MNKLKEKLRKKDNGGIIDEIGPMIFTAIAMAIMIVAFSNFMINIDRKNDVEQVARKYILMMESTGYLDSTNETNLKNELTELGVSNIDLSGTTKNLVGYGEAVTLQITGDLAVKTMGMTTQYQYTEADSTVPISIYKVSTAKH